MNIQILNPQERTVLNLRELYEQRGYKKYKMGKFEEYELYSENKSFLKSENIIAFNDLNGKLLALKPDVTLSIVKSSGTEPQKLYYTENVYRVKSGQYREIMQVGLEYIGKCDMYTMCEVISLASKSLDTISENYSIDISHMGFITGLLSELELSEFQHAQMLKLIGKKDAHEIRELCESISADSRITDAVVNMVGIYGVLPDMLKKCLELDINEKTHQALQELTELSNTLAAVGADKNLKLDFSIINDMSYYNGIIFQGFINGVAGTVLAGGRYDNLLSKFGKHTNAIGFAVYLDMLEYLFSDDDDAYDVDVMLVYDENADAVKLADAINSIIRSGKTVCALMCVPKKIKFGKLMRFGERGLEEVEADDKYSAS